MSVTMLACQLSLYESWWVRREELDLSDWEANVNSEYESHGIKEWTG